MVGAPDVHLHAERREGVPLVRISEHLKVAGDPLTPRLQVAQPLLVRFPPGLHRRQGHPFGVQHAFLGCERAKFGEQGLSGLLVFECHHGAGHPLAARLDRG